MKRIALVLLLLASLPMQAQQIEKLQKKVAAGNTEAMLELADCYEAGYGLPVDTAQALELFRRADALGNADAKGNLSRLTLYYSALGHDSAECFRLAQAASDAGSPYGTYRLGRCYLDGISVLRDPQRGHQLVERAADKGCDDAIGLIARGYLSGVFGYPHDMQKGYKYAKKMAEGSCSNAKYTLMADYYASSGDFKTALSWLNKGVAVGNVYAMAELARYTENGWGMPVDERAALAEYRRLKEKYLNDADFLSLEAKLLLGAADTTLRDSARALQLFLQIGDAEGYDNYDIIGLSYIYGYMTPIDSTMAYHYWLRGARKNDTRSMTHLAQYHNIYDRTDSARYYLLRAYDLESAEAAGTLAQMAYNDGNIEQAIAYGLQAADWGDEEYRTATAELYAQVLGDDKKALECYDRAIANGYMGAYLGKAGYYRYKEDEKQFRKILEKGGENGCQECYDELASYYEQQGDYKKAASYYEKSGDPQADFRLSVLYIAGKLPGDSVENAARGFQYLRRAAEADYPDAVYWLGVSYTEVGGEPRYDSALLCFQHLADRGHEKGLLQLGICYELGHGVDIDTVRAMDYYRKAGEAGSSTGYVYLGDLLLHGSSTMAPNDTAAFDSYVEAASNPGDNSLGCLRVAKCLLHGIGVAADTTEAIEYARQAAHDGSYEAMSLLGDAYYYGWAGLTPNKDTAYNYYYLASQGDDPRGDYMIGDLLYEEEMYEQSLQYLASAARNGNLDALVAYARALWLGAGIEEDATTACDILENAAPRCTTGMAHFILGYAHFVGRGRPEDTDKALQYFDTAISLGHTGAMLELGSRYLTGNQLPRDTVKGLEYYNRAVNAGSVKAMLQLASGLYSGEDGFPHDAKRAAELFQMAADRGSLEGLCRLGLCYEEGEGVILNSRKAYNLYLEAAERGSSYGMYLVAMCYIEGVYVKEDKEQAAEWFLKGAEAGDVRCAYFIGQMYAKGDGVKKNKKEAKRWLTIAAENGIEAAEQLLKEL